MIRILTATLFIAVFYGCSTIFPITNVSLNKAGSICFKLNTNNCVLIDPKVQVLSNENQNKIIESEKLLQIFILNEDVELWNKFISISELRHQQMASKYDLKKLNDINYLKSMNEFSKSQIPFIKENYTKYNRQYIISDNLIIINCLLSENISRYSEWENSEILIYDGGPSYFQISVDLDQKCITSFNVNGFA